MKFCIFRVLLLLLFSLLLNSCMMGMEEEVESRVTVIRDVDCRHRVYGDWLFYRWHRILEVWGISVSDLGVWRLRQCGQSYWLKRGEERIKLVSRKGEGIRVYQQGVLVGRVIFSFYQWKWGDDIQGLYSDIWYFKYIRERDGLLMGVGRLDSGGHFGHIMYFDGLKVRFESIFYLGIVYRGVLGFNG